MKTAHVDRLSLSRMSFLSRRTLAGIFGTAALALPGLLDARKKKRKKVKRNEFGCVNVGSFCKRDDQCCSGICGGKRGKKTCRAHDTGGCQTGEDICADVMVPCTNDVSEEGFCVRTTGNAGYCFGSGRCSNPRVRRMPTARRYAGRKRPASSARVIAIRVRPSALVRAREAVSTRNRPARWGEEESPWK